MKDTIEQLSSRFCASMLVETRTIAADGYPKNKQDLFMEDGMCHIKHQLFIIISHDTKKYFSF